MNQLDLTKRIGIITGAARGIGYAIARRALQSGATLSLWDVDRERLESARGGVRARSRFR
jgi:3-oxoacyl-[acyl-carrier protein] reductase